MLAAIRSARKLGVKRNGRNKEGGRRSGSGQEELGLSRRASMQAMNVTQRKVGRLGGSVVVESWTDVVEASRAGTSRGGLC